MCVFICKLLLLLVHILDASMTIRILFHGNAKRSNATAAGSLSQYSSLIFLQPFVPLLHSNRPTNVSRQNRCYSFLLLEILFFPFLFTIIIIIIPRRRRSSYLSCSYGLILRTRETTISRSPHRTTDISPSYTPII